MKKLLKVTFGLALAISLSSCEELLNHEHVFDDMWSSNEDYHWHSCISGFLCKEQGSKAEHNFEAVVIDGENKKVCNECGYEAKVSVGEHTHSFKEEFSYNEDNHWHGCEYDGCGERNETQAHEFGNPEITQEDNLMRKTYTCLTCGYSNVEEITIESIVEGEASWKQAFENLEFLNFSMTVNISDLDPSTGQWRTITNNCQVTPTSAYYNLHDSKVFYTFLNEDNTCTTYMKDYYVDWTKLADTSNTYLIGAQTETVLEVSFAEHFNNFTYDKSEGSYKCAEEISCIAYGFDGTPYDEKIYCYNVVVKITNGEISYISADYYFGGVGKLEGESYNFIYYNIGYTEVTIPQNIIDNAIIEENKSGEVM